MKMMLVLVLSWVLVVSADILHQDVTLTTCSETFEEMMYGLDGEELWYADFKAGKGVDTQPDFMDHITWDYANAVGALQNCKHNLGVLSEFYKDYKPKQDPPSTPIVYPRDQVELGDSNSLICHVTGFYPAPVTIFWKKNGDNVTQGITQNPPFMNKDATFSQFSRLQFTPQQGDIYSCSVSHLTLDQPSTRIWEVPSTQPGVGPAVFCGLGLTVGLLGVAAGTFFLIKGNECS
ncbi:H-2 class II histocompatibility antigen, A-U alpha chain-like [Halichoeres trimaculatus]|uniref:H-2 class II histocompatibility antigen, A-U alpha chain-like n=1 Tax=Halichoeres trimaculatus TaxID=147232 RepID=UPI003D9E6643